MSETHSAKIDVSDGTGQPDSWAGLKSRAKWYAGLALVLALAVAWIDGGEEPLHPIVQPVELPENG
jgi:hypothetical protein